jgi:23S rRNA (uracil1939-C5)-methyltransferase
LGQHDLNHAVYEVDLLAPAHGGVCLGRLPDGRAVFVPFALPGERVRVRLVESKRTFARAELLEVLQPAPQRIAPRCPHYGLCGGCHYQHTDYATQCALKAAILREQLQRLAGIVEPPLRPIVPSPQPWNYRNTVQFHLDPQGRLGYHRADSHQVVAIRECHLPEPVLNQVWPQLEFEPRLGLERVELRAGSGEEVLLILESQDPQPPEFSVDFPLSAVHLSPAGTIVLAGEDYLVMEILGRPFKVSAPSFFQVNTAQAAAMVQHLLDILPLTPQSTLLDVYCGVGLFTAFLAPRVGRCLGVEVSPSACEDFAVNLDEFDHVALYQGAAEEILPWLDVRPDVVVVDPPRAGMAPAALEALIRLGPTYLAYVSCDPATLARDLKHLLGAGYRLLHITPFDLFPQTYHIESISLLVRAA